MLQPHSKRKNHAVKCRCTEAASHSLCLTGELVLVDTALYLLFSAEKNNHTTNLKSAKFYCNNT